MMAQFLEIKEGYPNALLFYRMGDFYELFFDDAVAAAEALDIALTKRGKHLGQDIPMCGVPVHAAENYLLQLIRKGFRVAVCEQMENPAEAKKRGSKSVVRREVVRLVTPGTLTEDSLLDARQNNYLAAFAQVRDASALAWIDISTGELRVVDCASVRLGPELARLSPREVLIADARAEDFEDVIVEAGAAVTLLGGSSFDSVSAEKRLLQLYGVASLDAFGGFERSEISALGALIDYLTITQKATLPHVRPPAKERLGSAMQIDAATRRNLELTQSLNGGRAGSLLATIDRTLTAGGGRLLARRLSSPSTDLAELTQRHENVAWFAGDDTTRNTTRSALRAVPDMDRALTRLSLGRGGPRDLAAIRDGLEQALILRDSLHSASDSEILSAILQHLDGDAELLETLDATLIAEPPLLARDGGYVASGHNAELDELRALRDDGRKVIAGLQSDYTAETGITSLKIKHNNVLGYFIETPATHAQKMLAAPLSENFIHRQTTANAVRFTTVALSEMETKILNAGGAALSLEAQIFQTLVEHTLECADKINQAAAALAQIDLHAAFAELARADDWVQPNLEASRALDITDGRHPVVEAALRSQSGAPFISNSCDLTAEGTDARILLLTGPNMAGKSTYLRQTAIIALLAQIGSFVPAKSARIGLVSQLFSRVGASDDLARGRSTFMVEMVETASILNQADDRSLVILDEIGRGTATYDGLSIAWAVLEHLHEVNACRALFATHYHELTALGGKLSGVSNATVAVKEWEGDVIFLHEVREGAADRSYGVQVAKLAGLPDAVVERARIILDQLEEGDREGSRNAATMIDDLPLFAVPAPQAAPKPASGPSALDEKLDEILPDELTPKDALQLIYELKDLTRR